MRCATKGSPTKVFAAQAGAGEAGGAGGRGADQINAALGVLRSERVTLPALACAVLGPRPPAGGKAQGIQPQTEDLALAFRAQSP
jgi:hypothetical protein